MNRLKYSAFAMSLMMLANFAFAQGRVELDFLGLESEITPSLEGSQKFTPDNLFDALDWNTKAKKLELDKAPLKGQTFSLIPWDELDPEEWLDISQWIVERSLKDKMPDWQMRLRDDRHHELVGKMLRCRGICKIYRGTRAASGQYLSRINEGDEIVTDKDSAAWIFLADGTLVRISSETSVSFLEINLSKENIFYLMRLNSGEIFYHPRTISEFKNEEGPETDAISLPLMMKEANQSYFERKIYQAQDDFGQLFEITNLDDRAIKEQIDEINRLRQKNNQMIPKAHLLIVTPNSNLSSTGVSFNLIHNSGNKTYFKKRFQSEDGKLSISLRGYNDTSESEIIDEQWHMVSPDGRNQDIVTEPYGELQVSELITKRIKTIELAREIWFESITLPLMNKLDHPKELATLFGYNIWSQDLKKREDFLKEFTRRIETTHLRTTEHLFEKMRLNGVELKKELTNEHYVASLNYYLKSLKTRYHQKQLKVKGMTELQYYVWVLKNAKN